MCAEIPEWLQFLGFFAGFLAICLIFVAICMKIMPSETTIYGKN